MDLAPFGEHPSCSRATLLQRVLKRAERRESVSARIAGKQKDKAWFPLLPNSLAEYRLSRRPTARFYYGKTTFAHQTMCRERQVFDLYHLISPRTVRRDTMREAEFVLQAEESYRGFILSWIDPPLDNSGYVMTIGSERLTTLQLLEAHETVRQPLWDLEAAKREARAMIDEAISRGHPM